MKGSLDLGPGFGQNLGSINSLIKYETIAGDHDSHCSDHLNHAVEQMGAYDQLA